MTLESSTSAGATVIEFAYVPIAAVFDVSSSSNGLKEIVEMLKAAEGCLSVRYGRQIDGGTCQEKDVLEFAIEWTSLAAFEAYPQTPGFQILLEKLTAISTGPPTITTIQCRSNRWPSALFSSPILEMTYTHVSLTTPQPEYEAVVDTFLPKLKANSEGIIGSATGWVVGEQEKNGQKVMTFLVCTGWESVEAHRACRQVKANNEAIKPWKEAILGAEMHYVSYD